MVALTRDFHVFVPCVTTSLPAILFSVWHIAETRDVRALSRLLIRHYNSILSSSFSDRCGTLDVASCAAPIPEAGGNPSLSVFRFPRLRPFLLLHLGVP